MEAGADDLFTSALYSKIVLDKTDCRSLQLPRVPWSKDLDDKFILGVHRADPDTKLNLYQAQRANKQM